MRIRTIAAGDSGYTSGTNRAIEALLDKHRVPHPVREGLPDPDEIRRSMRKWMRPVEQAAPQTPPPTPVYKFPAFRMPVGSSTARSLAAVADRRPGRQWTRLARWLRLVADEMDAGAELTPLYVWARQLDLPSARLYTAWRELRGYKLIGGTQ